MKSDHLDRENRARKHGLTEAERQMLVERHFETAKLRQAESDLSLIKAVKLGEALQRLNGG